jgi:hypothetical protein
MVARAHDPRPRRPASPAGAARRTGGNAAGNVLTGQGLLNLQRTAGNRAVTAAVVRVSRQRTAKPDPKAVKAPTTAAAGPVVIKESFAITPGGLAPGAKRTPDRVYRGDLLTFEAVGPKGTDIHDGWVSGTVVGSEESTDSPVSLERLKINVRVGSMGKVQGKGKAPELVTAVAQAFFNQGGVEKSVSRPFAFKVVADLDWLADRATIAGQEARPRTTASWPRSRPPTRLTRRPTRSIGKLSSGTRCASGCSARSCGESSPRESPERSAAPSSS